MLEESLVAGADLGLHPRLQGHRAQELPREPVSDHHPLPGLLLQPDGSLRKEPGTISERAARAVSKEFLESRSAFRRSNQNFHSLAVDSLVFRGEIADMAVVGGECCSGLEV